jgi:hypothetical protein
MQACNDILLFSKFKPGVLLHEDAQEVGGKTNLTPRYMHTLFRRCDKSGGQPQHLSLLILVMKEIQD